MHRAGKEDATMRLGTPDPWDDPVHDDRLLRWIPLTIPLFALFLAMAVFLIEAVVG
jgi:hypothetical protein